MVKVTLLSAGYCTAPEHLLQRGGRRERVRLPALFTLIEHPQAGVVLFDTGYSHRFQEETARGLNKLYARVTPVTLRPEEEAKAQLAARGIGAADVAHIVISHFHADHIGALRDFPRARFHYQREAWTAVRGKRGVAALRRAFLPGLLPPDFEARGSGVDFARARPLPPELFPFERGVDLLGDERLWLVPLPGHATGQIGLTVISDSGLTFLIADACWQSVAYRELRLPAPVAYLLFPHPRLYDLMLKQVHGLWRRESGVRIIPSHCEEAARRYAEAP